MSAQDRRQYLSRLVDDRHGLLGDIPDDVLAKMDNATVVGRVLAGGRAFDAAQYEADSAIRRAMERGVRKQLAKIPPAVDGAAKIMVKIDELRGQEADCLAKADAYPDLRSGYLDRAARKGARRRQLETELAEVTKANRSVRSPIPTQPPPSGRRNYTSRADLFKSQVEFAVDRAMYPQRAELARMRSQLDIAVPTTAPPSTTLTKTATSNEAKYRGEDVAALRKRIAELERRLKAAREAGDLALQQSIQGALLKKQRKLVKATGGTQ